MNPIIQSAKQLSPLRKTHPAVIIQTGDTGDSPNHSKLPEQEAHSTHRCPHRYSQCYVMRWGLGSLYDFALFGIFFFFLTVLVYQQGWINLTSNSTEEPSETCTQIALLCSHTNSVWKLSPKTLRFVVQTDFHIFPGAYSDRPSFWPAILVYAYQGE